MNPRLQEFFATYERIFVLTGAGISTASGIPDYRDERGDWKHRKPMEYRDFVDRAGARRRYWARSYVGWQRFVGAAPNAAHAAVARLEKLGRLSHTVTQNVDGLHQRAGSRQLTELHGSLASVACLDCGGTAPREEMQRRLLALNPILADLSAEPAPDGDARLEHRVEKSLQVPACDACGGVLKPEVVFFGETIPKPRVEQCFDALADSDAMLVVGSSLMVYSGFRFARQAHQSGKPVVAINRGRTRADDLLSFKVEQDCAAALDEVLAQIAA